MLTVLDGFKHAEAGSSFEFPKPLVRDWYGSKSAYDSGVLVKAAKAGTVTYVSSDKIVIQEDEAAMVMGVRHPEVQRTNQDTCFNQKPTVYAGQHVEKVSIAAVRLPRMGISPFGRNILVGFVPCMATTMRTLSHQ